MAHAALPRRDAPEDERWEPFEYHGEQWIADLEQSWLTTFRNDLADWILSREMPEAPPPGPRVASHRLSGSELYLHDLLEKVRVPWWRCFRDDLRDFWTSLRAPVPGGPGLDLSLASQHIRQLVPAMQRSLVHSIAVELRYCFTRQNLTAAERAAAKPPKYHPPLDIVGVIVAIAWHATIVGVALAYSAVYPHPADARPKMTKWPTTPIYFVPEPKPKEEPAQAGKAPALAVPSTTRQAHQPSRRPEPAPVMASAPAAPRAAAPVVEPPKVVEVNSSPALPRSLAATAGARSAPVLASGSGGGMGGGNAVGGAGMGAGRGSGTGAGTGTGSTPPQRIRVSQVSPGSLLHDVKPSYPHAALMAHVQGDVILHAVIAKDGTVKEVSALNGHPLLRQAAVDAVRQRRYRPPMLNGVPVEIETEVTVSFVSQ
jgi:protein TonB